MTVILKSEKVTVWRAKDLWYRVAQDKNIAAIILKNKIILIDPGVAWWEDKLYEIFPKVDEIWLTHGHPDHCAIAGILQGKLGCRVISSAEDKKIVENPTIFMEQEYAAAGVYKDEIFSWYLRSFDRIILRVAYGTWPPAKVDATFEELGMSNDGIQVIELPGHTPSSVGFYLEEKHRKILIVGDIFQHRTSSIPILSINLPRADLDSTFSSLRKIEKIKPDVLISGHGIVVEDPNKINKNIEITIRKYEGYINEILGYIKTENEIPKLAKLFKKVPLSYPPNSDLPFIHKRSLVFGVLKSLYRSQRIPIFIKGFEKLKSIMEPQ